MAIDAIIVIVFCNDSLTIYHEITIKYRITNTFDNTLIKHTPLLAGGDGDKDGKADGCSTLFILRCMQYRGIWNRVIKELYWTMFDNHERKTDDWCITNLQLTFANERFH